MRQFCRDTIPEGFPQVSAYPALIVLIPCVLALASMMSWAVSSPPGSSPDEHFHLSSTWCGLGERDGLCKPRQNPNFREVPRGVAAVAVCFAFDGFQSAACQIEALEDGAGGVNL